MNTTEARNFSLEELQMVLESGGEKIGVFLYPTTRWIDWVDSRAGDARVIEVDQENSKLICSFSNGMLDQEAIDYDPKMRFHIKKVK